MSAPDVALTMHFSAGGAEAVVSRCNVEFDVRLDAAGEGWISHQEMTAPSDPFSQCTRKACAQAAPPTSEGRAWSIDMQEAELGGFGPLELLVMFFCVESLDGTSGTYHCEVTIPMAQTATHRYRFVAQDASGHGSFFPHCELTGVFDHEAVLGTTGEGQAEQHIEIRHT